MNANVYKIAKVYGISKETAAKLVDAGYATPAKIKAAKDSELTKVVGSSDLVTLKKRP